MTPDLAIPATGIQIGELTLALLIPMALGLRHAQASLIRWLLAPVAALVGATVLCAFAHLMPDRLTVDLTPGQHAALVLIGFAVLLLAGYAAGRLLARVTPTSTHLRGTQVIDAPKPRHHRLAQPASGLTLAGVSVPALDETKHFKFIGTTGAGKSTAIREVLRTALQRGDRAIIADPDGGYLKRFYDPYRGDEILNPFDERTAAWDLFGEIREPYDVDQLARSLIPNAADASGLPWDAYGRTFLAALLRRAHEDRNTHLGQLWREVAVAPIEDVRARVAGTPAQPFLEPGNEKMFGSIRSVATSSLAAFEHLHLPWAQPLSVRAWVQRARLPSRILFLPYSASQIATLRSVISSWLRLAIFEAMNQPEGDQRLWFVIDELDALGAIDGLKDALARLRKFGGRCVLGFQSIGQVSALYGRGDAQTIVENCGNTLILRCSSSEGGGTAQFASHLIGQREVLRRHESVSHSRDLKLFSGRRHRSRTVSTQPATEWAVLPAEIEQLPDLRGILKLASRPDWCRVALSL